MTKTFLLVGCGNIGFRHLEGMIKFTGKKIIHIVEPNIKSQKSSKQLLDKSSQKNLNYKIFWYSSIEELDVVSDLAIIATNSIGRVDIVNTLLKQGHKNFLIEKIVCQSNKEYLFLLSNLKKFNAKAWINTNRRYFKAYNKIKKLFKNECNVDFSVFSTSLGLGTNTIHYVDLFNWITNQKHIQLNGSLISPKLLSNKRGNSFMEFSGTIFGKNNKGIISITSKDTGIKNIFIKISSKNNSIFFDEINGIFYNVQTKKKSFFEYEHVSKLTPIIIHDILKNDCSLPTANDIYQIHTELFNIFNLHLEKTLKKSFNLCPIT